MWWIQIRGEHIKIKKIVAPLAAAGIGYYLFKKSEEQELDNDHIDRCRNKIIAEGYNVKDSYTLNLIENPYFMFYFEDDGVEYEVKYIKETETIQYIKEV